MLSRIKMADTAEDVVPTTMEDLFGDDDGALDTLEGAAGAVAATEGDGAATLADIFGDADLEEAEAPSSNLAASKSADSRSKRIASATLNLPALPRLSGPGTSQVSLVRMPRIVGTAPTAYDPDTYDEEAEASYLQKIDKSSASETLVRFRFKRDSTGAVMTDAEGRPLRESNARVVEWQDGSLTLHVGKEVFSLRRAAKEQKASEGAGAGSSSAPAVPSAGPEGQSVYLYARVTSEPREGPAASPTGKAAQPKGRKETVLEAQAAVQARFTVGGLAGSAVVAQSVLESRAARSRASKRQKVRQIAITELGVTDDLEEAKNRRIRQEEEAARQLQAQKRKADAVRAKDLARGDRYGLGLGLDAEYGRAGAGVGDDDLSGDEGGTFNLKAMKKRAKSKRARDDEDDEEGGYRSMSADEEEDG